MKKIWIIAADKKEIPRIDVLLKNFSSFKYKVEFQECGIGLFESFSRFATLLDTAANAKKKPDAVLLVGTGGSPDADHVFKIALTNLFINPRFDFEELPEFLPRQWTTDPIDELNEVFLDKAEAQNLFPDALLNIPVYSTFGISKSADHLDRSMAGAWENMEALSLSYTCHKRQIPFMALLCCTNQICPDGRKQWQKNYQRAGEILFDALSKLLG